MDASVVVAAAADRGAAGQWAETIVAGSGLVAPHGVLAEAFQAFRRMERVGTFSRREATDAARGAIDLAVQLVPFEPFAGRVWELRHNLSVYDAWYVAMAEAFELPLATLDRRLRAAPGTRCEFLVP